ncbi:PfkB family carbohydrate kinase [Myxococcota bacterium]|nr:PfkB family carbohydrate kinase [Myxococcota bacterium]
MTPEVVVVGSPSVDRLRADDVPGGRILRFGGAGYFTALAARRAGARVGLLARVPSPLPAELAAAFASEGPGPGLDPGGLVFDPAGLPTFDLEYDALGRATYTAAQAGAEAALSVDDAPATWLAAPVWHVAALGGRTALTHGIVRALRARGYAGRISAGTYPGATAAEPEAVAALAADVDLFFCNRLEAEVVFGETGPPSGTAVCITDADGPVRLTPGRLFETAEARPVPALGPGELVDPTGAGDALCGGFLAGLALGVDPLARGLVQARTVLRGLGAAPLLSRRARPDADRIARVATGLRAAGAAAALDFTGLPFPERDDPHALEIFAAATLHQYGFWVSDERGYRGPMWATAGGRRWKGSDFVWQAFTRAAAADPDVLRPARMATEPDLLARILGDDDGLCPLPALPSHVELHRAYGAALPGGGFAALLATAVAPGEPRPARALLRRLATLPGYAEDPYQKKAVLLLMILSRRPERFLTLLDPETLSPVVDYHLMRGCLRTGCVAVDDPGLRARLEARAWVSAAEEDDVREACWHALRALDTATGLGVAAIDGYFFTLGRRGCGEERPPECEACELSPVCGRHTAMFQPVYRTTAY